MLEDIVGNNGRNAEMSTSNSKLPYKLLQKRVVNVFFNFLIVIPYAFYYLLSFPYPV